MGVRGGREPPACRCSRGSEFRGIRPHNPGEPLNRVDWKATARTGNLMLRETEDPADGGVTVLLNGAAAQVAGQPPHDNFELAVEAAGSLADYALRTGHATTLLLPENGWRPARLTPDAGGHVRLLETLAGVTPRGLAQLGPTLRALIAGGRRPERTRMVILVVLALDDALVRALIALHREGLRAAVVHVPAASFAPAAAAESSSPGLALAAAGVGYTRLGRDDDLLAALAKPAPGPARTRAMKTTRKLLYFASFFGIALTAALAIDHIGTTVDRRAAGRRGRRRLPGRRAGARAPARVAARPRPRPARRLPAAARPGVRPGGRPRDRGAGSPSCSSRCAPARRPTRATRSRSTWRRRLTCLSCSPSSSTRPSHSPPSWR